MTDIGELIAICEKYAVNKGLCAPEDSIFVRNTLLDLFNCDAPFEGDVNAPDNIAAVLSEMTDYAALNGLIPHNTPVFRELFDNRIAGALLMPPSCVIRRFRELYTSSPEKATDWFYTLCRDSNYIRTADISRNICYKSRTAYGQIDVTINLTKPEKDPKEIALAASRPQTSYPKCQLCPENVGYAGRINYPPRRLLRTIPIVLNGEKWQFQYSPYVYFNEHCIAFSELHTPMEISRQTFIRLFDFNDFLPHYFIGSNAGLPIAGGSILSHLHFQGGRYELPMMRAAGRELFTHKSVSAFRLNWPMPVIRLISGNRDHLTDCADEITKAWAVYSDPSLGIYAHTDAPHNTVTPILHRKDGLYCLDIVLRNNLTSPEYPMGVFHPHPERHHIKRENIGLIEVMGMFILPGRLAADFNECVKFLCGQPYEASHVQPHTEWLESFRRDFTCAKDADAELRERLAQLCMELLGDAAVFKDDAAGRAGMERFVHTVKFN